MSLKELGLGSYFILIFTQVLNSSFHIHSNSICTDCFVNDEIRKLGKVSRFKNIVFHSIVIWLLCLNVTIIINIKNGEVKQASVIRNIGSNIVVVIFGIGLI